MRPVDQCAAPPRLQAGTSALMSWYSTGRHAGQFLRFTCVTCDSSSTSCARRPDARWIPRCLTSSQTKGLVRVSGLGFRDKP